MGKAFSSCIAKTVGDQDNDGDQGDIQDVLYGTGKIIKALCQLLAQAKVISDVLAENGVDIGEVGDILNEIEKDLMLADKAVDKLASIKIPASLKDIGDLNQDGIIDGKDVLIALSNPENFDNLKIYLRDAKDFVNILEDAGVDVGNAGTNLSRIDALLNPPSKIANRKKIDKQHDVQQNQPNKKQKKPKHSKVKLTS